MNHFTKEDYKKVIKWAQKDNKKLFREASVTPGGLKKTILNMISVLSKRTGKSFKGNPDVVFNVAKPSGNFSGVKYYLPDSSAIRFNWKMGQSAELYSIDFFDKKKVQPSVTFENLELYNLNQILGGVTTYLTTGKTSFVLEEQSLKEFKLGNLFVKLSKAEKEEPLVSNETVSQVVKIKALTGEQVFEKIERDLKFLLTPTSGENLMIIAGDPGVGKTVITQKVLQEIGGEATKPPLHILPPVGSQKMKQLLTAEGEVDTDGKKIAKSVQSKMRELSELRLQFEPKWVLGSQDVKGVELFVEMYQANGRVLLYDDADTVFTIKENKLLLKQAMDNKPYRPIKWAAKVPYVDLGAKIGIMPKEFIYSGKMIIITNLSGGQIDPAIKSRSRFVDVDLSPEQFMDRLEGLIPEIQKNEAPYIPLPYFQKAFDWLKEIFVNKKVISKFDIRTFVNGLVKELYILGGDMSMWETIAAINIKTKYPGARFQIG